MRPHATYSIVSTDGRNLEQTDGRPHFHGPLRLKSGDKKSYKSTDLDYTNRFRIVFHEETSFTYFRNLYEMSEKKQQKYPCDPLLGMYDSP